MELEKYNPEGISTYNERPSQEAIKASTMISKYAYWMANQCTKERFHAAFGKVLGDHFWHKLITLRETYGPAGADIYLWYEMTSTYRDQLMHYILKTKYKGQ